MWTRSIMHYATQLSDQDQGWMTQPHQLAAAMRRVCADLRIQICEQGMAEMLVEEQVFLAVPQSQAWIREVLILGDGVPFCFARTVVPPVTYQQYQQTFDTLDTRFLGDHFLYLNKGSMTRSSFEYAIISSNHPYFLKTGVTDVMTLPARRSIFYIADQYPLLINEVFLPKLPAMRNE